MTGERKYFGTDGIRGPVGVHPITPEFVMKLGWASGCVLGAEARSRILIGKDTRLSGYMFESALEAGLSAAGVDIALLGPMPTPGIAYLTRTFRAQAGIVISASHNPYHDNGIKFFSAQGCKISDELECAIEAKMNAPLTTVGSAELGRAQRITDASGRYIEFCKSTIGQKIVLNGLKLVIDCANGATYHVAPAVFSELGAEVISIGVTPDGLNINDDCGATEPARLSRAVVDAGADLGIALDGDGDRLIMVDASGRVVDGDELIYIIAKDWHASGDLHGAVVGTQMSNLGLEQAIRALGVDFKRAAVGDRYVLEMLRAGGWELGGETSGHILCLGLTTTGDGIISALQVLAVMVRRDRTLLELTSGMSKYPQRLVNVEVASPGAVLGSKAVQSAADAARRELADSGRVLLRASGTEPVVRVMVEGDDDAQVNRLVDELAAVVKRSQQQHAA